MATESASLHEPHPADGTVVSAADDATVLAHDVLPFHERRIGIILLGSVPFVLGLIAWALLPLWRPSFLRLALPELGDTANALYRDFFVTGTGISALRVTLTSMALGLLVAAVPGIILGAMVGLSRTLQTLVYPLTIFFQAIPLIVLAPLIVLVFGFGQTSKVVLASIIAFFPIFVGVMQGMRAVRLDEIDLLRTLGASRLQIFLKVRLPRAVPSTFGGIQLGTIFALIGAIIGEFLGGGGGLGYYVALRSARIQVPGVYSMILLISCIAVAVTLVLRALDRRLSDWAES